MEFKELFNPLKKCLGDGHNRQYFFRDLMAMITTVSEEEWGTELDPNTKRTKKNTILNYIKRGLSKKFAQSIVNRLTPEVLADCINKKPLETRNALSKELSVYVDDINTDNVADKAAELMVEIINCSAGILSDKDVTLGKEEIELSKRKIEQMKNVQKTELESAKYEIDQIKITHKEEIESIKHELESIKVTNSVADYKYDPNLSNDILAKIFLINHENERELVPLCPIAALYSPEHKHVRTMYTDYILLSEKIQRVVLKSCNAEQMIEIDSLHINKAMNLFCEDLLKFELSSKRYLYMFDQYFYRAFYRYSKSDINKFDNYSFTRLYKSNFIEFDNMNSSLDTYIDDYLWYKENRKETETLPPMDYLYLKKDLGSCKEEDLTYWLCRFVIDACNNLYHRIKKRDFEYISVNDQFAETQEDLYYCALLALYNLYLSHSTVASN